MAVGTVESQRDTRTHKKGNKSTDPIPKAYKVDTTHIFSFDYFFFWHYYIFLQFHLSVFYLLKESVSWHVCELRG